MIPYRCAVIYLPYIMLVKMTIVEAQTCPGAMTTDLLKINQCYEFFSFCSHICTELKILYVSDEIELKLLAPSFSSFMRSLEAFLWPNKYLFKNLSQPFFSASFPFIYSCNLCLYLQLSVAHTFLFIAFRFASSPCHHSSRLSPLSLTPISHLLVV